MKRIELVIEQYELEDQFFWPTDVLTVIDNALYATKGMGGLHQSYAVLDALADYADQE